MASFVTLVVILVVVLVASIALAVILSWAVGMVTGLIQHRRQPDFRERGRPGETEPPPGATPGQPSLQGTPGRWSRGRAPCPSPDGDTSQPRVPAESNRAHGIEPCGQSVVSPAGFEPALPTSSRWCLLPLGYEDAEPRHRIERWASELRGRRSAN